MDIYDFDERSFNCNNSLLFNEICEKHSKLANEELKEKGVVSAKKIINDIMKELSHH